MPQRCRVCEHTRRPQVELGLARGVPARLLAARFPPLSDDSIWRHRAHIPQQLMAELRKKIDLPAEELEKLRIEESTGLLEHLVHQRAQLYALVRQCEQIGDTAHAIAAHARITANLEQTGKLLELFGAQTTIVNNTLIASPDYLALRAALIEALRPYPEARRAVAKVLRAMESPAEQEIVTLPAIPIGGGGDDEAGG